MKNDISEVYDELSALLNDICDFLKDEAGQLSPKAATKAAELIGRSKTKLAEISIILPDSNSNGYMDMTPVSVVPENAPEYFDPDAKPKIEEAPEIYSDIDTHLEKQCQIKSICPHDALPASQLPKEKYGYIERKTKFLFIEHFKKLYAGIIDDWMLLYYSEKDCKPFETLHLKQFEVKIIEKKEVAFELIPKEGNGRIHFFSASTKKDMMQWIAIINRRSNANNFSVSKPLPRTPTQQPAIITDEPEIYEELGNESAIPPTSPPSNTRRTAEDNYDFLDSPDDIYDHIQGSNVNANNTENGYDSEEIYDTITPISNYAPEETYDTIGT